jgi:splicing suppressor protein 51
LSDNSRATSSLASSLRTLTFWTYFYAMPSKCKQRERILASGGADVPALPLGAVRGHLCFRCFEHSEKILKCAGCRRAGYCSQECQKLDWSATHKTQCKILKRINEEDLKDYSDSRTWAEYRRCLVNTYTAMIANINAKQNRLNTVIWCRS